MENIVEWIVANAHHAHWFILVSILLAGCNIPISIDLMVIVSAVLAATIIPEHALLLVGTVFVGACVSAWIAYWIGRVLGAKLQHKKWFTAFLPPERMKKMHGFYEKHGFWTLLVGRFIPFGIRNCLFMSTGMSRMPFGKFIVRDTIACFIWSVASFSLFYSIGQNYLVIYQNFMWVWFGILVTLAAIGIVIWRKKLRRAKS